MNSLQVETPPATGSAIISRRRGILLKGILISVATVGLCQAPAQTIPWSLQIANQLVKTAPPDWSSLADSNESAVESKARVEGLDAAWYNSANGEYFRYLQLLGDAYLKSHPQFGATNRAIPTANESLGQLFLLLYRVTLKPQYFKAAESIHNHLASVCNPDARDSAAGTSSSSATCPAEPFLAEYASVFQLPGDFAWITKSLLKRAQIAPAASGPGKDSAGTQTADTAVNIVDSLPSYPPKDPGRVRLIAALKRIAADLSHQNPATGRVERASSSAAVQRHPDSLQQACQIVYALLKGVRLGYLPATYAPDAERAWRGILKTEIQTDADGTVRFRSFPQFGVGVLLRAANEAELATDATLARGKTIFVDAWFNSQQRQNAAAQTESFHYKWSDRSDSGYALLGHMFRSVGMATGTLPAAPTQENLNRAQYYLIASPDIPIKNPNPHYMTGHDAAEVAVWVKQGGVLIMLENDPPNADIAHLNLLADLFGIHFDDVLHHHILGEHVEDGTIPVDATGPLFHHAHTLYMKDTCAISLKRPGTVLLRDRGDIVIASTKYGRGTVVAAVDPWLYNEYTDGRKNPAIYSQFDNFAAGKEFVRWLSQQRPPIEAGTGKR